MDSMPDIARLIEFSQLKDRGESRFFTGRRDELDWLLRCANAVRSQWRSNEDISGSTLVVSGCPGMGKTALLRHFATTCCNQPDDPASPMAIWTDVDHLHKIEDVAAALRSAMDEQGGVLARLTAAAGTNMAKRFQLAATAETAKAMWRGQKSRMPAVCVLVDEIQNVDKENRGALRGLHDATLGLPILPVYTGLNDSIAALRNCGVSRLGNNRRHNLQPLPLEDAKAAIGKMMGDFRVRVEPADRQRWVEAIAEGSSGFPQHLHTAIGTAAGVLAQNGGRATAGGLRKALALGAQARASYYKDRLRPGVTKNGRALVALVHFLTTANAPLQEDNLHAFAFRALREHCVFRKPSKGDAVRFVDHLIQDGILQQSDDLSGYVVPIPSMRTWLLDDYARIVGWKPPPAMWDSRGDRRLPAAV